MAKVSEDEDDLVDAPTGAGHNSVPSKELMKIIEHVEALMEERSQISEVIREAMDTAKSKGFSKWHIRETIKLRALDSEKRRERQDLLDLYLVAAGLA